jgi:hypothetical protein
VILQERGEQFHDAWQVASLGAVVVMHGEPAMVGRVMDFKFQQPDVSFSFLPGLHILHSHPCSMIAAKRPYDSLLYAPGVIAAGSA